MHPSNPLRPPSYGITPQCTHPHSLCTPPHPFCTSLHPLCNPPLPAKPGTSFAVMHNVAKSRMQTFQGEASHDEIKKAQLLSASTLPARPSSRSLSGYPSTLSLPMQHPLTPTPASHPPRPTSSFCSDYRPRRLRTSWTASRSSSASRPLPHHLDSSSSRAAALSKMCSSQPPMRPRGHLPYPERRQPDSGTLVVCPKSPTPPIFGHPGVRIWSSPRSRTSWQ